MIVAGCKVLVAGIERENYEEFSPVLQRRELQFRLRAISSPLKARQALKPVLCTGGAV